MKSIKQWSCRLMLLISAGVLVSSCEQDEPEVSAPDRTVVLYMVGDNSLDRFTSSNIKSIMSGMADVEAPVNFLIYEDSYTGKPTVWKINRNARGEITKDAVLEFEEQNSVDPEVMGDILNKACRYPSKEKGLILWSHATGWLPSPNYSTRGGAMSRSFGQDENNYMEVWDLREVLEGVPYLDFLIFDACHMGSVEVAYELKDQVRQIVGSPTEVMGEGFPYKTLVPVLNEQTLDLKKVCQVYMDYYNGDSQDGTISLVNTASLEALAASYKAALTISDTRLPGIDRNSIQQFGRYLTSESNYQNVFFDLENVVEESAPEQLTSIQSILSECVSYSGFTPSFLNIDPISRSCRLTVFVPEFNNTLSYNDAYTRLRWFQATR